MSDTSARFYLIDSEGIAGQEPLSKEQIAGKLKEGNVGPGTVVRFSRDGKSDRIEPLGLIFKWSHGTPGSEFKFREIRDKNPSPTSTVSLGSILYEFHQADQLLKKAEEDAKRIHDRLRREKEKQKQSASDASTGSSVLGIALPDSDQPETPHGTDKQDQPAAGTPELVQESAPGDPSAMLFGMIPYDTSDGGPMVPHAPIATEPSTMDDPLADEVAAHLAAPEPTTFQQPATVAPGELPVLDDLDSTQRLGATTEQAGETLTEVIDDEDFIGEREPLAGDHLQSTPQPERPQRRLAQPRRHELFGAQTIVLLIVAAVAAGSVIYFQRQNAEALREELNRIGGRIDTVESTMVKQIGELGEQLPQPPGPVAAASSSADVLQQVAELAETTDRQLAALRGSLQSVSRSLGKSPEEQQERLLQALKEEIEGMSSAQFARQDLLQARVNAVASHLDRISTALEIPGDQEISQVLLIVDAGERMEQYHFQSVYRALLKSIEAAIRFTPERKIGLMTNRGGQTRLVLNLDAHGLEAHGGESAVAATREQLASIRPTAGEDSDWAAAIDGAINYLAVKEGRCRVVYVTCNSTRELQVDDEQWDRLHQQAGKFQLETWVIQLLKPGEPQRAKMVEFALRSGGEYLAIPGGAAPEDFQLEQRLGSALLRALDLPRFSSGRRVR